MEGERVWEEHSPLKLVAAAAVEHFAAAVSSRPRDASVCARLRTPRDPWFTIKTVGGRL